MYLNKFSSITSIGFDMGGTFIASIHFVVPVSWCSIQLFEGIKLPSWFLAVCFWNQISYILLQCRKPFLRTWWFVNMTSVQPPWCWQHFPGRVTFYQVMIYSSQLTLQLSLGDFPTGLGGCDSGGAGCIEERSLQHTCSVLLSRLQIALPPSLEVILALPCRTQINHVMY